MSGEAFAKRLLRVTDPPRALLVQRCGMHPCGGNCDGHGKEPLAAWSDRGVVTSGNLPSHSFGGLQIDAGSAAPADKDQGGADDAEESVSRTEVPALTLQRAAATSASIPQNQAKLHEVLHAPGHSLDKSTLSSMRTLFGHDFTHIRIHRDAQATESARALGAYAYTVGQHIVFQNDYYQPDRTAGRRLLAHELTHVLQQRQMRPTPPPGQVQALNGGAYRIAIAPLLSEGPPALEDEARATAESLTPTSRRDPSGSASILPSLSTTTSGMEMSILRARIPLPSPVALCGRTLTHVDVEPPRARPLEPCLPSSVLVTRINIVGRDLSRPTPGRGLQVFNLHVGFYRDPATGRLCAIADDSKMCVAPRCLKLGCFPTAKEVLDAIIEFLKAALLALGIIALAIIIALLIELLWPILVPAPLLASVGSPSDSGVNEQQPAVPNRSEAGPETEA
jgi:hypothetical protein